VFRIIIIIKRKSFSVKLFLLLLTMWIVASFVVVPSYVFASASVSDTHAEEETTHHHHDDKSEVHTEESHNHVHKHHHGGHMPAGVMFGHMLDQAGDFMFGYRLMIGRQGGDVLHGTHKASDHAIINLGCSDTIKCGSAPSKMNMKMHMINMMYAPTNWMNLMVMPTFVDMNMDVRGLSGGAGHGGGHGHAGISTHSTGGVGDTTIASMFELYDSPGHWLHLGLGFSAPTGNVGVKFKNNGHAAGGLVHFGMQLGSGTWDFMPSLTYTGEHNRWSWGAQLSGTKRMEDQNKSGYRLGDMFQATTWGGYRFMRNFSVTLRGIYTVQGAIHGDFNTFNARTGPMDFPANHGGQFWDIGIGLNAVFPRGILHDHTLSVEWLQPMQDDVNGYRLERKPAFALTWNYTF